MQHNLYHMIGLDRGYYWSMERFFERLDECIEFYSNSTDVDDARHKQWCIKLKPMSLAERTWARMERCGVVILSLDADGTQLSMKQIAELECQARLAAAKPRDLPFSMEDITGKAKAGIEAKGLINTFLLTARKHVP
jgi:hypothetical protein